MRSCVLVGATALVLLGVVGCTPEAQAPVAATGPTRKAFPACPRGTFAAELDILLPSFVTAKPVDLAAPTHLDRTVEPGCVVPFRDKPGQESLMDAGRVVVKSAKRDAPKKLELIGRGKLEIGRGALHLLLIDDAGDESFELTVKGAHVHLARKKASGFDADVDPDAADPLPFPFDALVSSLSRCDGDERLGATLDGNIVEARRGGRPLWRSRWLQQDAAAAVDTSVLCGDGDVRQAWRSSAGDIQAMLVLLSVRSQRTLVIYRQGASDIDDYVDPGMGGSIR